MGPTLKSILYKGHFSMYLDSTLVPYFRLSSIFLYFLIIHTPLISLSLNTDRLRYTDADYAYGAHSDVFLTYLTTLFLFLHSFTFFS